MSSGYPSEKWRVSPRLVRHTVGPFCIHHNNPFLRRQDLVQGQMSDFCALSEAVLIKIAVLPNPCLIATMHLQALHREILAVEPKLQITQYLFVSPRRLTRCLSLLLTYKGYSKLRTRTAPRKDLCPQAYIYRRIQGRRVSLIPRNSYRVHHPALIRR